MSVPPAEIELGVFTDQAYNLILLAEDEARMLGQPSVNPEHVLLALAREGNVERLLSGAGVRAAAIHAGIVEAGGLGAALVLGRVPWSPRTDAALRRAVDRAAQLGVLSPSSEHVLLGLADDERVVSVLEAVGVADVEQLVERTYPSERGPLTPPEVALYALRARDRSTPQPGPILPAFERFTAQARSAIGAAERSAAYLGYDWVEPWHLLLGILDVEEGVGAAVLQRHGITLAVATERTQALRGTYQGGLTGLFSTASRQVVAEDALEQAYRCGHPSIGTGHLLLALLKRRDDLTAEVLGLDKSNEALARDLTEALPGDEEP